MGKTFILHNRVPCPDCQGTGKLKCPICKGEGRDYRYALFGVPCPPNIPCERCNGTGYIRV